jgi:hypothetical protein
MTVSRRQFVQSSMLAGAALMFDPFKGFSNPKASTLFGLNSFITDNADAVFIMKTNVDLKTNAAAIKAAGLDFGRSVFGLTDNIATGIPLTHKIIIKPNLTCRQRGTPTYTIEGSMGIVTDENFVEGVIDSLKELGITSSQFYIREVNCPDDLADGGYLDMAARTGIDLKAIDTPASQLSPEEIVWVDVPNGVWFNKIPYLWPVNAPDTWLLNISKLKAHGMGMTLCAKNLQGTIAMDYQAHCTRYGDVMYGVDPAHIQSNANSVILANYNRHKIAGIPRWDKPGTDGGIWMETWASRCLDNNSVNFAGLHIIEGIYGRDGDFLQGPSIDNLATDYMTNYIIFGKNQFHVDMIGHYLGGHEPGNFGLFHLAAERGLSSTFNPGSIPLYNWDLASGPVLAELSSFQRIPLKTYYLQRNYGGKAEPKWHLVNEPYNYEVTGISDLPATQSEFSILAIYPNPVHKTSLISFYIPRNGHISIEIINANGSLMDVLVNKQYEMGTYSVSWDCNNYSQGMYIARMQFEGATKIQKMIVTH